MSNLWSRQALVEFAETNNRAISERMTSEEIETLYRRLIERTQAAIAQMSQIEIETWKIPATAEAIAPVHLYVIAVAMAYGTRFGQYPKPAQVNYLCNADRGAHDAKSFTAYVAPDADFGALDIYRADYTEAIRNMRIPDVLRADSEAISLANAFYRQMIDRTHDISRPPTTLGEYRMTTTGLDMIDDLGLKELRLVITNAGLWFSAIFPDDAFAVAWWCPDGDTFIINYGQRFAWIFRVFCACLWHDLRVTESFIFRVRADRARRSAGQQREERVIYLPKRIRELVWEDETLHNWEAGLRRDYSVRAHYRHLHESWQASEQAIQNALDYGFPEPPDGFTFVQPYEVGAGQHQPPRIVAKGLQAAKVALARL